MRLIPPTDAEIVVPDLAPGESFWKSYRLKATVAGNVNIKVFLLQPLGAIVRGEQRSYTITQGRGVRGRMTHGTDSPTGGTS